MRSRSTLGIRRRPIQRQSITVLYSPDMASTPTKKTNKKRKASLDAILSTVERGFPAVADDISDVKSKMATKDDLADLRKEMATKDDIADLRNEMHEGFASINSRLDQIIQIQLDEHAMRIKKLEAAVFSK